jgi:hypothetical protein
MKKPFPHGTLPLPPREALPTNFGHTDHGVPRFGLESDRKHQADHLSSHLGPNDIHNNFFSRAHHWKSPQAGEPLELPFPEIQMDDDGSHLSDSFSANHHPVGSHHLVGSHLGHLAGSHSEHLPVHTVSHGDNHFFRPDNGVHFPFPQAISHGDKHVHPAPGTIHRSPLLPHANDMDPSDKGLATLEGQTLPPSPLDVLPTYSNDVLPNYSSDPAEA